MRAPLPCCWSGPVTAAILELEDAVWARIASGVHCARAPSRTILHHDMVTPSGGKVVRHQADARSSSVIGAQMQFIGFTVLEYATQKGVGWLNTRLPGPCAESCSLFVPAVCYGAY